jgi:hypothetical protein
LTRHRNLDLFGDEAVVRRNRALRQVSEHAGSEFTDAVTSVVATLRGEWTGEQIRIHCEAVGVIPHHHNAWGAVVNALLRNKVLIDTGRVTRMRGPKSNARKTTIYRIAERT